ncbi:MAG TPA: hypothetical protein PKX92_08165 [Edaphocola sp.]|nr:hypothetical protein [Edaphocola sp.]
MEPLNDFETRWNQLGQLMQKRFGKMPHLDILLFLIGVNEYQGDIPENKFTKEEKEDLMHVATCTLLAQNGYFQKIKIDEEGWPHFEALKLLNDLNTEDYEQLLKQNILDYFQI